LEAIISAAALECAAAERETDAGTLTRDEALETARQLKIHRQTCSVCQPGPGEKGE
jgi:hypothetical protein